MITYNFFKEINGQLLNEKYSEFEEFLIVMFSFVVILPMCILVDIALLPFEIIVFLINFTSKKGKK